MAGPASAGGYTRPLENVWENVPGNNAVTGAGVPVPKNGYGAFNANTARQANKYLNGGGIDKLPDVWGGANQRFQGLTNNLGNQLFSGGSPWAGGGGIWGQMRPGPDSPLLKGYLGNLQGGGRNLMNQYIDQTAYAGPNRAGTGIVGGSDPRAAMAANAAKGFAGQFGDQYGKAYDMASRDFGQLSNLWGQGLNAYGDLAGLELGALKGSSDYNLGQGNLALGAANIGAQLNAQNLQGVGQQAQLDKDYWQDITNWQRGGADRAWQEKERNQQQSVWDMAKYDRQAKQQQMERDRYLVQRQNAGGHGLGWLNSSEAGDAAMRLAGAEGRDWWRDPARGGGGSGGGSKGGGSDAASWAGFTSGLLRGAKV